MQAPFIRPATDADIPLVQHLAHQTWPVAYSDILSPQQLDYMLTLFYSPESLRKQMAEGQQFCVIEDPQAVGFAAVGPVGEQVWKLYKLYVSPSRQGSGLGAKLLSHIETFARHAGASSLTLQVNRANAAKDFYARKGFKIIAERDFDIGNGFFMNDFVMEKAL